jgi:hypothetical protein
LIARRGGTIGIEDCSAGGAPHRVFFDPDELLEWRDILGVRLGHLQQQLCVVC